MVASKVLQLAYGFHRQQKPPECCDVELPLSVLKLLLVVSDAHSDLRRGKWSSWRVEERDSKGLTLIISWTITTKGHSGRRFGDSSPTAI